MLFSIYPLGFYFIEEEGTGDMVPNDSIPAPYPDPYDTPSAPRGGGGTTAPAPEKEYATYADWLADQTAASQELVKQESAAKLAAQKKKQTAQTLYTRNQGVPGLSAPGNVYVDAMLAGINTGIGGSGVANQAGVNHTRNPFAAAGPIPDSYMRPQAQQYTFNTAPAEWMGLLGKLEDNKDEKDKKKKEAR